MVFKRLFSRRQDAASRAWSIPDDERIYAIGDIHGCRVQLDELLAKIEADDAERGPANTTLVFLGDLPDRGPDSRGVIERLMTLDQSERNTVFLAGNHEELLIRVWEGERQMAPTFNRAGGRETLMSYGVSAKEYDAWDLDEVTAATYRLVPKAHIDFLKSFKNWHRAGDYLFVHAGIRPGVDIEDQDVTDLRWIRGEFVRSDVDHGMMVVHGHTITEAVDERPNRIGSGRLTAIGLEGAERWYLST
jgi:serine/threonine protein phosphatase 1